MSEANCASGSQPSISYVPVVLCGGSGTRLWPLSRNGFPKQFLVIEGNQTLFQLALARLGRIATDRIVCGTPLIVTNEEHRFMAQEQMREIGIASQARLLLEPQGRNTAPAITLAALAALEADGAEGADDPVLVVSPADQMVTDSEGFERALRRAVQCASAGAVVVLGVEPTRAETGYGYIKHSDQDNGLGQYDVLEFTEKPDAVLAQHYLDQGGYLWNGGLFVVKASVWLAAVKRFEQAVFQSIHQAWGGRQIDGAFVRPEPEAFKSSPSISADYAVLERCPGSGIAIEVVSLDAGWSDLGAWDSVWQVGQKDAQGNVARGDVLAVDTKESLIHANHRLVGVVGVDNLVVIETADAVLVGHKDQAQLVKTIVQTLSEGKREEHQLHRKVHRPWGWYDSIDEGPNFKVKRIMVKPGASLSLQKHHHRAEHWIVVKGEGEVTCDDRVTTLGPNESTFIPLGSVHRLANRGQDPLEIIEVQSGAYLGEDDIVRFEDTYGRVVK